VHVIHNSAAREKVPKLVRISCAPRARCCARAAKGKSTYSSRESCCLVLSGLRKPCHCAIHNTAPCTNNTTLFSPSPPNTSCDTYRHRLFSNGRKEKSIFPA
jgi:hypothetical protein